MIIVISQLDIKVRTYRRIIFIRVMSYFGCPDRSESLVVSLFGLGMSISSRLGTLRTMIWTKFDTLIGLFLLMIQNSRWANRRTVNSFSHKTLRWL